MSAHLTEWTLRRLHTGELPAPEAQQARTHVSACAECQGLLNGFKEEQARFEAEVSFDRFVAGVERTRKLQSEEASRPRMNGILVAVAATVLLVLASRPIMDRYMPGNRTKGGASTELRIGGDGFAQRPARPGITETLAPGERVRIGYTAGTHRYVLAVSVDDGGEVSALYPAEGTSLAVEPGPGTHWLPDSVAFTGSGHERVVTVLSDAPLEVESVREAAHRAWEAAGKDVAVMSSLGVDGEESHWLLSKP